MKKISIFLTLATTAVMLGGCYLPPPHYRARVIHPRAARAYRQPVVRRRHRQPVMRPDPRVIVSPRGAAVFY